MAALPRALLVVSMKMVPTTSRSTVIAARTIATVTARRSAVLTAHGDRHAIMNFGQTSKLPVIHRRWLASEMTLKNLREGTLDVLKLFDKVNPSKVTLDAHFMKDLGLDSLDAVEIVMAFEDEFGVEISDEEAEKIFTCNDAVELLKFKLGVES